ncbi:MAG: hypothetical protein LBN43_05030 [Oscillospiraceae bacterium]|jgi:hypothetical protein|nr:hypothetical protein [Oscillospiraceae bacterium]
MSEQENKNEVVYDPNRTATAEDLKLWAAIVADPKNLECTCTVTVCEYHGKCKQCLAVHRYYEGFPGCLRGFVDRIKAEKA